MKPRTVPCRWCGVPTEMLGTRMCDRCWELDLRVSMNLELAQRMVQHYMSEEKS